MIKLVVDGKNKELIEKKDLEKLKDILKEGRDNDLFDAFLKELK